MGSYGWSEISSPHVKCRPAATSSDTSTKQGAKRKFLVSGLMASQQFQKCQFLLNKLAEYYPETYDKPEIRPMLNVEWCTYLLKMRRKHGGALWKSNNPVVVFMNGDYFGDDVTLVNFVSQTYLFSLDEDFEYMGEVQLVNYFTHMTNLGKRFVTLVVTCNDDVVGTLLIMLHADFAPKTCKFFIDRCKGAHGSWLKARVCRVVPDSWIQIKGMHVPPYLLPCENYNIPHDRRGIVSTCNAGKHCHNTQQFNISLDATPWMDHKYVAFGLVVQGEEVLQAIERLEVTPDHVPTKKVTIAGSAEFVTEELKMNDPKLARKSSGHMDLTVADVDSEILEERYRRGMYCMTKDLNSHLRFLHLPNYLMAYLKMQEQVEEEQGPSAASSVLTASSEPSVDFETTKHVGRSKGFIVF